jgi:hypothetical protein
VKVALSKRFAASAEISDAITAAGHDTVMFKSADELESLLDSRLDVSFALDINYHEAVRAVCAERHTPYAAWSFDSGVASAVKRGLTSPLRDCDYFFLFHKKDCSELSLFHPKTYYLPVSAGDSFIMPPRKDSFLYDVLAVMNSYSAALADAERAFRDTVAVLDSASRKKMELAKSLMEISVEKHIDIVDRYDIESILDGYIKGCGLDPFGDDGKKSAFCRDYAQILSSRQRERCLSDLAASGVRLDVYGDSRWRTLFGGIPSVVCHEWASYGKLSMAYNSAKININLTQIQNMECVPQRIFHLLASGGFTLTNDSAELRSFFVPGKHLETFKSFGEMMEKVRYYLEHDSRRVEIAETGNKEFCERHRMGSRLDMIFSVVGAG